MLMGEYAHSLDAKGRVIFPARLREEIGNTFVVTNGLDKCLYVYSPAEWEAFAGKLMQQPTSKGGHILRFMLAKASRVDADKQGRILIPANLRTYADITKDVVIIGTGNRAEIWDKDRWNAFEASMSPEDIAAAMEELGL